MLSVKVEALAADEDAGLELRLVAGRAGLGRKVTVPRIQKPGLAIAGYTEQVHPERVQVLGATELGYLVELCEQRGVALFTSTLPSSVFIDRITKYLEEQLSPTTSIHGVLMDVLG